MLIRLEYESCLLHATSTSAQYFLVLGSASLWILYLCLQLAMRPPLKNIFSFLIVFHPKLHVIKSTRTINTQEYSHSQCTGNVWSPGWCRHGVGISCILFMCSFCECSLQSIVVLFFNWHIAPATTFFSRAAGVGWCGWWDKM